MKIYPKPLGFQNLYERDVVYDDLRSRFQVEGVEDAIIAVITNCVREIA